MLESSSFDKEKTKYIELCKLSDLHVPKYTQRVLKCIYRSSRLDTENKLTLCQSPLSINHHWQQNSKEICINKQKNDVRKCTKQRNSCHAVLWLYAKSFCLQKQYGSQKKQTGEFLCAESIWQPKKPRQDTYSSPSHQTYQHSRQNHRKPARHLHTDAQKHM